MIAAFQYDILFLFFGLIIVCAASIYRRTAWSGVAYWFVFFTSILLVGDKLIRMFG